MVCPAVERSSGEVVGGSADVRVPSWLTYEYPARLVAYWRRSDRCPDGRHLWDALAAVGPERETSPEGLDDADVWERREARRRAATSDRDRALTVQAFRLVLTCTRCGVIEHLNGEAFDDGHSRGTAVHPVPLRAGELLAQQVFPWHRMVGDDDGLTGNWTVHSVHTGEAVIGRISAVSPRRAGARVRHTGRLATWPDGVTVTAPSPLACLRKLARHTTTTPDATSEGVSDR
jgi:hypothetical protein